MENSFTLGSARVAILGLGLIGGSLALALRGQCLELLGIDHDQAVLSLARQMNVVDRISQYPSELLPQADLIILAAPVGVILNILRSLPELHPGSAIIMDTGSTKGEINHLMSQLPERFEPLGGHPMCGKEQLSLANADKSLFRNATFAFTPLPRTTQRARSTADQICQVVGAKPLWLDAQTHDRWVAATSHLPYLVSAALTLATPSSVSPLIGTGFTSTTRLAATAPSMMLDVLMTNRGNVIEALSNMQQQISELKLALTNADAKSLAEQMTSAVETRARLINGKNAPSESSSVPQTGDKK